MCPPRMKQKDSEKLPLKWFFTKETPEYSRLQALGMQKTNIRTTTSRRFPSMRNVSNDMQPGREQANYFPLGKQ